MSKDSKELLKGLSQKGFWNIKEDVPEIAPVQLTSNHPPSVMYGTMITPTFTSNGDFAAGTPVYYDATSQTVRPARPSYICPLCYRPIYGNVSCDCILTQPSGNTPDATRCLICGESINASGSCNCRQCPICGSNVLLNGCFCGI